MSDELRDRIAAVILDNFNPPDEKHPTWWINPDTSAQAIIDDLGLEVVSDGGRPEWKLQIVGRWEKQ